MNLSLIDYMQTPIKIAFGHQARVGKDTAANIILNLCLRHGVHYSQLAFANKLYDLCAGIQLGISQPVIKTPKLLQNLGGTLREIYGENIFADIVRKNIHEAVREHPNGCIVVTDVRYPNEYEMLRKEGFLLVKIVRDDRVIDRDQTHPSECSLAAHTWDVTITNSGSLELFEQKITELVMKPNVIDIE